MVTLVVESSQVSVPDWVRDLAAFRRWADSEEFPENGRVCFLQGEVWVDMSKEQIFTHAQIKTKVGIRVGGLVELEDRGIYITDGLLLTNQAANLSVVPDGAFISNEAIAAGRCRLIEEKEHGYVEAEGSADMLLEVVSDSSAIKDLEILRQGYWEADVREYWIIDARSDPATFEILRHTARGYVSVRKQAGWLKSPVFGKSFRLTKKRKPLGHPEYYLDMRDWMGRHFSSG